MDVGVIHAEYKIKWSVTKYIKAYTTGIIILSSKLPNFFIVYETINLLIVGCELILLIFF
jgi:hypothetical protein